MQAWAHNGKLKNLHNLYLKMMLMEGMEISL